ncbi:MAG TPA: hypothetical protein VEB68_12080 [Croceibacterium sp.]|nr:hypothetical protein [Croceibacterium sp.]
MPVSSVFRLTLVAAAVLLADASAARDEIVRERGWPRVAFERADGCEAEVRGNGQIFRIAGAGLRPGEVVRFHLANADIRPIEHHIVADGAGTWAKFYMPFLWNRAGGTVTVELDSASCALTLSFPWTRQNQGYNSRVVSNEQP